MRQTNKEATEQQCTMHALEKRLGGTHMKFAAFTYLYGLCFLRSKALAGLILLEKINKYSCALTIIYSCNFTIKKKIKETNILTNKANSDIYCANLQGQVNLSLGMVSLFAFQICSCTLEKKKMSTCLLVVICVTVKSWRTKVYSAPT